jgi:hypothetical protein
VKELLGRGGPAKPAEKGSAAPIAAAPAPPPAPAPVPVPASHESKEDYFDRLDAAFTSASAAPPLALVEASKLSKPGAAKTAGEGRDEIDVINPRHSAPAGVEPALDLPMAPPLPVDLPVAVAPAPAAPAPPQPVTVPIGAGDNDATRPVVIEVATPGPRLPARPVEIPALADAFAALLAAEQVEPLPPSVPTWPGSGPPTDVIADQVVRRVLDQMSDRVVRETVTTLVSEITERLVREEIEKIKATIK